MHTRHFYIGGIVFITLGITYLHYTSTPDASPVHSIYMDLYYIPVLIGAMLFGLKGALLTYLLVACLYLPYVFVVWRFRLVFLTEDLMHILFFGFFAFLAGFFVDRAIRYQREAERERYLAGLGRAATVLAHDLQNPLIVISALLKEMQKKPENTREALAGIKHAVQQMKVLVRDTLDFAKPIKLSLAEEDLREVLRNSIESCRLKAMDKSVALTLHLPEKACSGTLDATRLERAFINVITNAIDASEPGQEVTVELTSSDTTFFIAIRDEGIGMDIETLHNVFIPFYSKKATGTGVGMAITKKIIEEHRGSISIASTPGAGTEVRVAIPMKGARVGATVIGARFGGTARSSAAPERAAETSGFGRGHPAAPSGKGATPSTKR
jgi:signal transduction histidine kinase